jgi:hypothetical protein
MIEVEQATEPLAALHSTTSSAVDEHGGAMYQSISESLMVSFAMTVRRVFDQRARFFVNVNVHLLSEPDRPAHGWAKPRASQQIIDDAVAYAVPSICDDVSLRVQGAST